MKKLLTLFLLLIFHLSFAQPNDCVRAVVVCGDGRFSSNASGPGNTQEILSYCSGAEHNSFWIKVNIVQSGTLGFVITPDNPDINVDYDFWVFGANRACGSLGTPIRCNTTNPQAAGLTYNHTGMNGSGVTSQSGPGANGNGYVRWIDVVAGEYYYIAIDRPEGDGGFTIEWIGSATSGTGAFANSPVANDYYYPQCSTNNQAIFNLNTIKLNITNDIFNNSVTYFTSHANAIDNVNPITNPVYSNITNPQTIYARVQNSTTQCFAISEVTLVVNEPPIATFSGSNFVCAGSDYAFTITGTPNALVTFTINGVSYSERLNATGEYSGTNQLTSNSTIVLERVQILNTLNTPICTTELGSTNNIQVSPTPVINNVTISDVCNNNPVNMIVNGTPNATFQFTINNASDIYTATLNNVGQATVLLNASHIVVGTNQVSISTVSANTTNCSTNVAITETFNVFTSPDQNIQQELKTCVIGNNTVANFDLTPIISSAIGSNIISIHTTITNAQNNNAPITSYTLSGNEVTLYIRIGLAGVDCFSVKNLVLKKFVTPVVSPIANVQVCDSYILPNLTVGEYFTQPNRQGRMLAANTVINSTTQLYVNAQNDVNPDCFTEETFSITVNNTPVLANYTNVTACTSYTLPNITVGNYYTQPNGAGTQLTSGQVLTTNQTVYVYAANGSCTDQDSFTVTIINTPNITNSVSYQVCDTNSDGLGLVDLTQFNSQILNSLDISQYQINYYASLQNAQNQTNAITNLNSYTSSTPVNYEVYAVVKPIASVTSCNAIATISIEITPLPSIASYSDVTACGSYTLPTILVGNYFTQPNGRGRQLNAGTILTSTQTVYVYATNGSCTVSNSFVVNILETSSVNSNFTIQICDQDFDGIVETDLTQYIPNILGTLNPSDYNIVFYERLEDAQNQQNSIAQPLYYVNNTPNNFSVFATIINRNISNGCNAISKINFKINPTANLSATNGFICVDPSSGRLLNPYLITVRNATRGSFTYDWYLNGNLILLNGGLTYQANQAGVYTVHANNTAATCTSVTSIDIQVQETSQAIFDTAIVTNGFTNSQTIEIVLAGGIGNYEYSLDGITYQNSPIFERVLPITHTVYIRDKNNGGCDVISVQVQTLTFRNFFTPNADGIFDTWNIEDLANQSEAYIMIYDRFGKLIKQIYPSSSIGWDGTLNGKQLPSTDYWFVVYYREGNITKEFRSHFSLIR